MNDQGKTPAPSAVADLLWVVFILIALAIAWYASGGQSKPEATSGPFLRQPQEKYSAELQEEIKKITSETPPEEEFIKTTESIYKNKAELIIHHAAKSDDPQSEYLEIRAFPENKKPIPVSNWKLEGKKGLDISLGDGVYLVFFGQVNLEEKIFLNPGEKVFVVTGKSPIGISFRLNTCTGYFEQFQDFNPGLPKQCPLPKDEDLPSYLENDDDCLDYIERLPRCEAHIKTVPPKFAGNCQNYINEKINYKTCVDIHKDDPDFYKPEWRIYLGRSEEMWKQKRETIILWDENGKIIDQKSY